MNTHIRTKALKYLEIGAEEFKKNDAFGFPKKEWDNEIRSKMVINFNHLKV